MVSFEDSVVNFLDYLVDAHELERNKSDGHKNFYNRARYVSGNFLRYSNDTMANLMFDTKLRQSEYDRMNSVVAVQQAKYFGATTLSHFTILAYSSYFFRYRRLGKLQVAAVGGAYCYAFGAINSILYKLIVDKPIIAEARAIGQGQHVQPTGSSKPRGLNY